MSIDSLVSLIKYKQKYCIDKTKVVIDNARNYSTVPKYIKMMLTRAFRLLFKHKNNNYIKWSVIYIYID